MPNKPSLNESFSRAMNYYKSLRNTSNKDIADALDIPATTVSSWNTGRHLPDMERLHKLATYLKAPLDQFFHFAPDKIPDKELSTLHNKINTDKEFVLFLKVFLSLPAEDRHLLKVLALKLKG